ncbi:MAG: chemotaxis protein CheD [bacterium]|jgi:chemotaxis protein CheD
MAQIVRVPIGGIGIAKAGDKILTVVGSCVSIMLYDKKIKLGGMIHIMLGYHKGRIDNPTKYVDTGVPFLIQKMQEAGAGIHRLKAAKIAGGGEMFPSYSPETNVAKNNVKATYDILAQHDIQVIAADCGRNKGRRVTFDIETAKVLVQEQGKADIIL